VSRSLLATEVRGPELAPSPPAGPSVRNAASVMQVTVGPRPAPRPSCRDVRSDVSKWKSSARSGAEPMFDCSVNVADGLCAFARQCGSGARVGCASSPLGTSKYGASSSLTGSTASGTTRTQAALITSAREQVRGNRATSLPHTAKE